MNAETNEGPSSFLTTAVHDEFNWFLISVKYIFKIKMTRWSGSILDCNDLFLKKSSTCKYGENTQILKLNVRKKFFT